MAKYPRWRFWGRRLRSSRNQRRRGGQHSYWPALQPSGRLMLLVPGVPQISQMAHSGLWSLCKTAAGFRTPAPGDFTLCSPGNVRQWRAFAGGACHWTQFGHFRLGWRARQWQMPVRRDANHYSAMRKWLPELPHIAGDDPFLCAAFSTEQSVVAEPISSRPLAARHSQSSNRRPRLPGQPWRRSSAQYDSGFARDIVPPRAL